MKSGTLGAAVVVLKTSSVGLCSVGIAGVVSAFSSAELPLPVLWLDASTQVGFPLAVAASGAGVLAAVLSTLLE